MQTDDETDFEMLSLAAVTRNVIEFLRSSPRSKEATPTAVGFGGDIPAAGAHPSPERAGGTGFRAYAPDKPCDLPGALASLVLSRQPTEDEMAEEMITVLPITGYTTMAHPSGVGVLVIKHLPGEPAEGSTLQQIDAATVSLQYGIRAEQCIQLAHALVELAERLRKAKSSLN